MCLQVFGANFKQAVSDSDYVPHTLAPELELGVRSVWNYQKGTQAPTLPTLADISNVLVISPNQLLKGCYEDGYSEKVSELIVRYKRSEHRRMFGILIEYFMTNHNTLKKTSIGRRIRTVRLERRLEIAELAKLVGVSEASIKNYETDNQFPRFTNFVRLCEALGVSAEFLLFDHLRQKYDDVYRNMMNLSPEQVELLLKLLPDT